MNPQRENKNIAIEISIYIITIEDDFSSEEEPLNQL